MTVAECYAELLLLGNDREAPAYNRYLSFLPRAVAAVRKIKPYTKILHVGCPGGEPPYTFDMTAYAADFLGFGAGGVFPPVPYRTDGRQVLTVYAPFRELAVTYIPSLPVYTEEGRDAEIPLDDELEQLLILYLGYALFYDDDSEFALRCLQDYRSLAGTLMAERLPARTSETIMRNGW